SRREFVKRGLGLGTLGGILLASDLVATEASGSLGSYGTFIRQRPQQQQAARPQPANWAATEDNILGPYHREGAPFRAKITPPLEAGTVPRASGRVFGLDTGRPLANAVMDIWQANAQGRYDNDDPQRPPAANVFLNRARLVTDE